MKIRTPPTKNLPEDIQSLIAPPIDLDRALEDLILFSEIDAAHLAMLEATGLVAVETIGLLASAVSDLASSGFASLDGEKAPRGLYFAYQEEISRIVGVKTANYLHTGRSRNDLNATIIALKLRHWSATALDRIDDVRSALLQGIHRLDCSPLPIHSQYQIAGPGQAWHYLASIEASLTMMRRGFDPVFEALQICPLGGGAGAGTSLPIDPKITAELLGFDHPIDLSIRGVAGREAAILFSNAVNGSSIVLSRLAQDMQIWLSPGLSVGDLPDDLSGASSMLPHKRNPYLLEHIKSISAQVAAAATECTTICLKVPFFNSVEISGYLPSTLKRQVQSFSEMCILSQSIINGFRLLKGEESISCRLAFATQILAEQQAISNATSVAEQHKKIADAMRKYGANGLDPWVEALGLTKARFSNRNFTDLSAKLQFGGGPGSAEKATLVKAAETRLAEDKACLKSRIKTWRQASRRRAAFFEIHRPASSKK